MRRHPLRTGIIDKEQGAAGGEPQCFFFLNFQPAVGVRILCAANAGSPVVSRAVGFIFGCSSLLLSVLMGIFFFKDLQH